MITIARMAKNEFLAGVMYQVTFYKLHILSF